MEKKFNSIVELFRKSYGETLTGEERERLEKLLENERLRGVWEEMERGDLIREGIEDGQYFSPVRGFSKFKRLRGVNKRQRLRLYTALGVAAAIVVLVVNVVFVWLTPGLEKKGVSIMASSDIFPEKNEVRLLLGNGDTVSLPVDKMILKERDGARIRCEEGILEYMTGEDTGEAVYNELIVPVGGECFLLLEDSSKVWLNADSRLKYPTRFAGNERRVELEGEAYFEVKPGSKPFVVHTVTGDVKVLGTSFDVRAYAREDMLTTLVSGRVRYLGKDSVLLEPGEQVVVTGTGSVMKREVVVAEYVAWKDGMYVFDSRPLEEITRDLERWYGVTITFVQPELKRLPFSGYMKRYDKINTFLDLLEKTDELKYKIEGKTITLFKE